MIGFAAPPWRAIALVAIAALAPRARAQDEASLEALLQAQGGPGAGDAYGDPADDPLNALAPLPAATPSVAGQRQRGPGMGYADPNTQPRAAPKKPRPKPLPPNNFQRFVEASVGRVPPMAGFDAFLEPPSTFAPAKGSPAPADYLIGPGDDIIGHVSGAVEMPLHVVVDRTGRVALPKVGTVTVAGVRAGDLESFLTKQLERSFRNFTVTATLGALRSIDVYVVGQARSPGKYTVSSRSSLVNALFATGGPNSNGSLRHIQLVREGKVAADLDLYAFMSTGDKSGDVALLAGDTIVYPVAGPRVALLGHVPVEVVYELKGADESLSALFAVAGGLPVTASKLRATLERLDPAAKVARSLAAVALDDSGLGTPLKDGDILTVFPVSPEYTNAVTLRGNVAVPRRYPHRPGMRVRDVIPDRDALISYDYYVRKNVLVQYAEPPPKAKPTYGPLGQIEEPPPIKVPFWTGSSQTGLAQTQRDIKEMLEKINWEYAVVERLNHQTLATELIPFHLGKAVLEDDPAHNLKLEAGDVITIFGESDLAVPQAKRTRLVRVEGEVGAPGVYQLAPGETLRSLIARVGGLTEQAYPYGLALRRASVRDAQRHQLDLVVRQLEAQMREGLATRQANLAGAADAGMAAAVQAQLQTEERLARERLDKLRALTPEGRVSLELDPSSPTLPEVMLEADDEIFVPARPSFVTVLGAVHNENSLLWKEGRTTGQYLDIAGQTASADPENLFVLRADGSVLGRNRSFWAFLGPQPVDLRLQPGDVIVVPERVDLETGYTVFMRGLKDWTQILANMGLAAAAIAVFR